MEEGLIWLPFAAGVAGMLVAGMLYLGVQRQPAAAGKAAEIAQAIALGARVFIGSEYRIMGLVALVLFAAMFLFLDRVTAMAFLLGAGCSGAAGFLGMRTATQANIRTATAAHRSGEARALAVAFQGGSVMGVTVAAVGLAGLGGLFWALQGQASGLHALTGFGMGASTVALFARVGGGIFTKTADVGADLAGKVEADIPEDDPRNPGVITDNVGDNVGDVAGMGADIFESYCGAMIAAIAIASTAPLADLAGVGTRETLVLLPLLLCTVGFLASLAGIVVVKLVSRWQSGMALRGGMIASSVLFALASWYLIRWLQVGEGVWGAMVAGTVGGIVIGLDTEYFTEGRPVRRIAAAGRAGPATVIISGLAVGMQSMTIPLLSLGAIIITATTLAGTYGVAMAAVGMLATVAVIMAIDAYGPVADNAGGIVEMSGMGEDTRRITDRLDALGNTTAAIGKGFAIGAAALSALALVTAFVQTVQVRLPEFGLYITDPAVLAGLFLGGLLPFLFSSLTMTAVGDAAGDLVEEIRRQFREIPGLLQGQAQPDHARCTGIATRAALQRMILPTLMAVLTPPVVGFAVGPYALGGLLGGAVLSSVLLALLMANAGGAWDNAKKYVEQGHLGGKGSPVHKACIVGDTVGDPFKDTAGPSLNILMKVMAIASLVMAPYLA